MGAMRTRSASVGRWVNEVVSFVVFCLLDIFDYLLCLLYKTADYLLEAEWKPCYCLSPKKLITTSRGNILLSHNNCESKILTVSPLQQLRYSVFFGNYLKNKMRKHVILLGRNVACLSNNNVRVQDSCQYVLFSLQY